MQIRKLKNFQGITASAVTVMITIYLAGCAGAKPKPTEAETGGGIPTAASADENLATGDSDSDKAMGLQTIHFPYDSSALDEHNKSVLHANAELLKEHPKLKIQIEGHCDQRGGLEYNVALGLRRANMVRSSLEALGIHEDRLDVISFGKRKPLDEGTTEEAYAKNRRANFVITAH